jgi:hypothetical protein
MIKLSLILTFTVLNFIISGCKKNGESQSFCASCTVKMVISSNFDDGRPITSETKVDQCDLSEEAYDDMLETGNATTKAKQGDMIVTTKMTTTCEKN